MYYLLNKDGYIKSMSLDTKLTGGGHFDGTLPEGFTEDNFFAWKMTDQGLVFDQTKLDQMKNQETLNEELDQLLSWFEDYDRQIMQYQRCGRLGQAYDRSIAELDQQAEEKQLRIREIRSQL